MKTLLKTDQGVTEFLKESNAIEDVWDSKSLLQAIKAWQYIKTKKTLTIKNILKTHAILMEGKLDPVETGAFRKRPVWIGGHEAPKWYVIPYQMDVLCGIMNKERTEEEIQQDHIAFETLHFAIDGNGRTGRILMNWQRIKNGFPILVIKESEKHKYYEWFRSQKFYSRTR